MEQGLVPLSTSLAGVLVLKRLRILVLGLLAVWGVFTVRWSWVYLGSMNTNTFASRSIVTVMMAALSLGIFTSAAVHFLPIAIQQAKQVSVIVEKTNQTTVDELVEMLEEASKG